MSDLSLSVFTPSNTAPEDLEFILVQRQAILQDAVERVRESALTGHKHHLLFVGPRGCGKTHLITLIVHRVGLDEKLAERLRIAWLNEDETCTTLLEFLLKIHAALEKRYPAEFQDEMLAPAFEMNADGALEFVSKHVLEALGTRTLMVAAENLDAIFENLGDVGQKQLRAFIQENPRLTIVATAQMLVESLSDRANPFYGFFQTEHLKPLSVEDATELLKNIALLRDNGKVVEFLNTRRGHSRVQALHHLSGGNHRIYIVLSQFITRDSIDALVAPFMKMVDELTPYYQERIRWLSPLQRRIVEFLCACENTVPVKEIAKRLFSKPPTISSQLQSLREKGYIEAHQRGRESLYEISEPMMRICVEVKANQRFKPLRLLVDFLRVWYDNHELSLRLCGADLSAAAKLHLESAIERNQTEGNLRKKILWEDFLLTMPEGISQEKKGDAKTDFESVIQLKEAPAKEVVGAFLALSELHWSDAKWNEGLQSINAGLEHGKKEQPPYFGTSDDLIGVVFLAGLSPESRRLRVTELLGVYQKNDALPVLGDGLVKHLGAVFRAGTPFPSADNFKSWLSAWEQAAVDADEFRLPLRLLRTGVEFVIAGGKDKGILLDLTTPERKILKQTLGLAESED